VNNTNILLDMYVKKVQAHTLAEAARKLGLTGPALSNWRNGTSHAQPEAVESMARACGLDPEEWVLRIQADRETIPARKKVWLRAAQRLAATAALIALTFGLAVQTAKAHPYDSARNFAESRDYVYYVKC
jgi:transcriptional regulator with XRE-family HTH domain